MDSWKQYVLSIIVCSLSCTVISQILPDPGRKNMMHLIFGMALAISILRPFTKLDLVELMRIPEIDMTTADGYIADGERLAEEVMEGHIKDACESYIQNKAKTLGSDILVEITMDEEMIPVFSEIRGEGVSDVQKALQQVLMSDLGIPKENQKWIWYQENNSS